MYRLKLLIILALASVIVSGCTPKDENPDGFSLINEGQALWVSGQSKAAEEKFEQAIHYFEANPCLAEKFNIRLGIILPKITPSCILSPISIGNWRKNDRQSAIVRDATGRIL